MRNPFKSSSYPKSADDQSRLVSSQSSESLLFESRWDAIKSHKYKLLAAVITVATLIAIGAAYYHFKFRCPSGSCVQLRVMSLNTWGMPATFGSEYKTERMKAIAEEVSKGDYDVYLFQELWMQGDYWVIRDSIPEGFQMTEFRDLALSTCDGRLAPSFCSGLAVVSRFPLNETEFNSYNHHGSAWNSASDGEWIARKGVGRVRVFPVENISVDIFVTHTAADPDPSHNYTNEWCRQQQVQELVNTYIAKSDADVVLLGGDFNAGPETTKGSPYEILRRNLTNSVEEIFYKLNEWLDSKFATYGNLQNTFSGHKFDPVIYDYIFFKSNSHSLNVHTNWFELPLFKTRLLESILESTEDGETTSRPESTRSKRETDAQEKIISFSDHEAITSSIYIRF